MPVQCDALTHSSRLCRGFADDDGLCHKHKNWYTDELWSRAINTYAKQWQARHPRASIKSIMYVVRRASVVLGGEQVEHYLQYVLGVRIIAQHIYTYAVDTGIFTPTLCKCLWKYSVRSKIHVLIVTYQHAPNEPIADTCLRAYDILKPYMKGKGAEFLKEFVAILASSLGATNVMFDRIFLSALPLFDLKELTLVDMNGYYKEMTERITTLKNFYELQQTLPLRTEEAMESVRMGVDVIKTLQRNEIKKSIAPFKEELMMVAWHPDRVGKILEAGGFALLDSY